MDVLMGGWINGRVDERVNRWIHQRMAEYDNDGPIDERQMKESMDGQTMLRWMD